LPEFDERRRVPGLRRDELAQLAGVSESYCTRLEQGLSLNASTEVPAALARALRLDETEHRHVYDLDGVGRKGRNDRTRRQPAPERITETTRQLIDAFGNTPVPLRNITAADLRAYIAKLESTVSSVDSNLASCLRAPSRRGFRSPEDIDYGRGVLHVRRQVQAMKGRLYFTLPKGKKTRVVDMPSSVAEELKRHGEAFPPGGSGDLRTAFTYCGTPMPRSSWRPESQS
jgi:transcriptional regulator with XRE-family HTH domain